MRNTKQVVYGSSYDRGLEHLLKIWPEVIKEVPDATLHIFYGWELFVQFYKDNPERMGWVEKMNKMMEYQGITHLGRISHQACAVEMENAGIWAYPSHFGEISCMTAMRAQAYGAIPVVTNYAALKETVQHGIKIDGDIYEKDVREAFKTALIALLKDEKRQEAIREPMMAWAREKFPWSNVAKQWNDEFKGRNLEAELEDLLDHNQALKAWELAKGTEFEKRIYPLVEHAFNSKVYTDYYSNKLTEIPLPEDIAYDCTKLAPRFKWLVDDIVKKGYKKVLDLGCADGYLGLTLAEKGIETHGVNLYKPSVELARVRAEKRNLKATFECMDLMDVEGLYDAVVMFELLEHLPDPAKALKKAVSLLKPNGSLYLSTPRTDHVGVDTHIANKYANPNRVKPWSDAAPAGHLRLWTEAEFRELLKPYKIVQFELDSEKSMLAEVQV